MITSKVPGLAAWCYCCDRERTGFRRTDLLGMIRLRKGMYRERGAGGLCVCVHLYEYVIYQEEKPTCEIRGQRVIMNKVLHL